MNKEDLHVRLPVRLYKVIMSIRPLFINYDEKDPMRGATTRALEYILQYYMESEDYIDKICKQELKAKKMLEYMSDKEKEEILRILQNES